VSPAANDPAGQVLAAFQDALARDGLVTGTALERAVQQFLHLAFRCTTRWPHLG
jgi:hypothetical protein